MEWNDGIWNGNRHFQACHKCVAPKRFPGCHDVCKEYADEKAAYEEIQNGFRQEKSVDACIRYANRRINQYYGSKRKEKDQ
jgi:hypothetical protein